MRQRQVNGDSSILSFLHIELPLGEPFPPDGANVRLVVDHQHSLRPRDPTTLDESSGDIHLSPFSFASLRQSLVLAMRSRGHEWGGTSNPPVDSRSSFPAGHV